MTPIAHATAVDVEQDLRISALESEVASIQSDLSSVSSSVDTLTAYYQSLTSTNLIIPFLSSIVRDRPYGTHYLIIRNTANPPWGFRWTVYLCNSISVVKTASGVFFSVSVSDITSVTSVSVRSQGTPGTSSFSVWPEFSYSVPPSGSLNFTNSTSPFYSVPYWSDHPDMPHLLEEEDSYEVQAIFVCLLGTGLFYFMSRLRNRSGL